MTLAVSTPMQDLRTRTNKSRTAREELQAKLQGPARQEAGAALSSTFGGSRRSGRALRRPDSWRTFRALPSKRALLCHFGDVNAQMGGLCGRFRTSLSQRPWNQPAPRAGAWLSAFSEALQVCSGFLRHSGLNVHSTHGLCPLCTKTSCNVWTSSNQLAAQSDFDHGLEP